MNDRYGVDPCTAATVAELAGLLRNFGPELGRFIVDFPSNWTSQAGVRFSKVADLERARLTEMLRIAKRSLLPTKTRYFTDVSWAKNAQRLTDVHGRIGPAGSTPPCRAWEDVVTDPAALRDSRGGHIPRTPFAYAEVAKPLFQISPAVALIDPHFHLRYRRKDSSRQFRAGRYINSFKALIQSAQAEGKVERFRLVVSPSRTMINEDNGAAFEADIKDILSDVGCTHIEVEPVLLNEERDKQHARYLLGNECGLKFDWGFDVKNDGSTNHVEWIGRAALEPLLKRFM